MVLLGAAVAALVWANSPWSDSYESFWSTDALDPRGRRGHLAGASALGERGPDGLLLPGRRARGEARARPGGAAGTASHRASPVRGGRRHGGAGADLPGVQRRRGRGARLGSGHVDRHGVRARGACAGGPRGHAPACSPADPRGHRRPRGAARDRHGLHGGGRRRSAGGRRRPVLPAAGAALRAGSLARAGRRARWASASGSRSTSPASIRCSPGWRSGSPSARIRPREPTWSA